jgi:cytochrome P450
MTDFGSIDYYTDATLVGDLSTFLFAAGSDTTTKLITFALRIIAENPEIQARLRDDTSLISNFVEEVLRYESVVKNGSRMARTTTTLSGVEIPAGTTVAFFPGSANRDPRRFEDPEDFRLDRPDAKSHLSFGRGIHSCPGGPLARIEARVTIERFLARTSDIRIDESIHGPAGARRYDFQPIYVLHGLTALHLELTPAKAGS